jgi:hypothetical protein
MKTIWTVLSERLKTERDLLGTRVEAENLARAWNEGRAYGEFVDGQIVSFCARWPTDEPAVEEVGTCWSAPEVRSRGYASRAFGALIHSASPSLRLFLITHRIEMVRIAHAHGWKEESADGWATYIPWKASCGVCDRIPEAEKPSCPYRAVPSECRMFVR